MSTGTPTDPGTAPTPDEAARLVVSRLTRAEKIALLSGADFWNTKAAPGAPAFMLTDGPHGLRKQDGSADHVGLSDSVPATCFPPAVTLGSTWDPALLEEVGAALGAECRAERVGVLLGPGLNLKRHPAGGRSFEYYSEDPLLAGRCAAALVRGIQSAGVGACLKHFAANNRENTRMSLDTIVDERTLRELYLRGFEIAVREGAPWTVMCAYNLVNGEHAGESRFLLTQVLREQWGFDGLVMSDWLAVADRPAGVHAGLDLEMPSSGGAWDGRVAAALDDGTLAEADLDLACARVVALARRVAAGRPDDERAGAGRTGHDEADARRDAHHALARRAAAAGTVMLTNDGILPLTPTGRIALIGSFAETPRYQGAGSSQVNPTRLDTALDAMRARLGDGAELTYARGYDPVTGEATAEDVAEAVRAAAAAEVVVLVVGLPAGYESEGFDRTDLRLPAWHDALVEAVVAANPRTVVVLVNGAPVEVDWAERPAALVEAYLGGQAGGSALVDVLVGDAEPGGRLAESFPVRMTDLPADTCFADGPTQVVYRETCYVGYRFHDTFGVAPRFCFGHGLGYTTFDLSGLEVTGDGTDRTVRVTVTNTGARAGSTVVQVYLRDVESSVHRPAQELAGFARVHLDAGASSSVEVALDRRAFAVWDVASGDWAVEAGAFEVRVGFSSRDVRATTTIEVASDDVVSPVPAPTAAVATDLELAALLGHPVPAPRPLLPLTYDSTLDDLALVPLGRPLRAGLVKAASGMLGDEEDPAVRTMMAKVVGQMPLRAVVASSGGRLSFRTLDAALRVLNLGRRRRS